MKMRSTGHIRQRTPGTWELRYTLGRDPATGKRRMATTTVKANRRTAEKELRRLLRTLDTGEHAESRPWSRRRTTGARPQSGRCISKEIA